jgi:hypothetical protein
MATKTAESAGKVRSSDIVVVDNFLVASRDAGYRSTSTALAEIVDNSIEAGATLVEIELLPSDGDGLPTVRVRDNGSGMSPRILADCLRFGGSSRFDRRNALGRFGMGLPLASISQARRVLVHTWRAGELPRVVYLDLDEISKGRSYGLSPRRSRDFPPQASPSGCVVEWQRCDRLGYERLGWLERALRNDFARIYRWFLAHGLSITINNHRLRARDPLMLQERISGATAATAVDPLKYEVVGNAGELTTITVRFTELPVADWHTLDAATKRRVGITRGAGVSVMRGHREIAYGWHLLGAKRRENYDDWWRCEIDFESSADEHFGVTYTKQGIRPTAWLKNQLEPDLEAIARSLNQRVQRSFEAAKFMSASATACELAGRVDPLLPVIGSPGARTPRGRLHYSLRPNDSDGAALLSYTRRGDSFEVLINTAHPAYRNLYGPLASEGADSSGSLRTTVECFMIAFVRTHAVLRYSPRPDWERLPEVWSDTLAAMLRQAGAP